jgi:hypothetical protein
MLKFYFYLAIMMIGLWLSVAGYRHIQENDINIMGLGLLLSLPYGYVVVWWFYH